MAIFSMCGHDGCDKGVYAKALCASHYRTEREGSICKVDECKIVVNSLGYCTKHYQRFKRYGDPLHPPQYVKRWEGYVQSDPKTCTIDGCERKRVALGLCDMHRARQIRNGDPRRLVRPRGVHGMCTIDGCGRKHSGHGLCQGHLQRKNKGLDVNVPLKVRQKGQKWIDPAGYVWLPGKKEMEHRAVMAEVIGRPLLPNENVHHKNGVRSDNRPKNLELWVVAQPAGQRAEDLVEWAREILALYGPLVPEPASPPALRVVA